MSISKLGDRASKNVGVGFFNLEIFRHFWVWKSKSVGESKTYEKSGRKPLI